MANVLIQADSRFPVDRRRIRRTINRILTAQGVGAEVEVSVLIVGDRKMKALNEQYRRKKATALVLAFPLETTGADAGIGFAGAPDNILRLGDIVISYPQARKRAIMEKVTIDDQVEKLVSHAMKHLLGTS